LKIDYCRLRILKDRSVKISERSERIFTGSLLNAKIRFAEIENRERNDVMPAKAGIHV